MAKKTTGGKLPRVILASIIGLIVIAEFILLAQDISVRGMLILALPILIFVGVFLLAATYLDRLDKKKKLNTVEKVIKIVGKVLKKLMDLDI